jgi:hypothetical protein
MSFCQNSRYIVFFADTANIPDSVVNKITLSNRFCMTVPIDAKIEIPNNLQECVALGKLEVALSLNPEPVLPIFAELASISNSSKKMDSSIVFEKYISNSFTAFEDNVNNNFGLFLNFAELSNDVLYYLANLGFAWVNIDNLRGDVFGAYKVNGITIFSLYKDFPTNQKDVMNWLSKKNQNIIPVLLTKKHLQDAKFMDYLIYVFDNSKYIKPAVPTYVSEFCKISKLEKNQAFQYWQIETNLKTKLCSAMNLINNYANTRNFNEYAYENAQNEFVYLLSYNILKNYLYSRDSSRKFNAAYDNIYHLLGTPVYKSNNDDILEINQKNQPIFTGQIQILSIPNGVLIKNEGFLRNIRVLSKNENIEISFTFDSLTWDKISFLDFYIALNNIEGTGSVSFISGLSGFFTNGSGWEYALRVYRNKAVLYKYSSNGDCKVINLAVKNNVLCIPQKYIRGNPSHWGYQAVIVEEKDGKKHIVDFLNQSAKSKESIISTSPFEVSMVR